VDSRGKEDVMTGLEHRAAAEVEPANVDPIAEAFALEKDLLGYASGELGPEEIVAWVEAEMHRGDPGLRSLAEQIEAEDLAATREKRDGDEMTWGGRGSLTTARRVSQRMLEEVVGLDAEGQKKIDAAHDDPNLSRQGRTNAAAKVEKELEETRSKFVSERAERSENLLARREAALKEKLAAPREEERNPVLVALNEVRDRLDRDVLLRQMEPLDARAVSGLVTKLLESRSLLAPAAIAAAALKFLDEPASLVPLLAYAAEKRGPRGTARIRANAKLLAAGVEIVLLKRARLQFELERGVVLRHRGHADMVLHNRNKG